MPEHGGGGLNAMALGFVVVMGCLLIALPRRYAVLALFASAAYMTVAQVVMVAGLNFSIIRILTLIGWFRLLCRGEFRSIRFNAIDRAMIWWTIAGVVVYTLLWQTGGAFIYMCGHAYDAIGLYVLFRALIHDVTELPGIFKSLAILILPLTGFMLLEQMTGRNIFAVFGGVPDTTLVRDGVLRCQGPFPHSILAGTFAAALIPFFLSLWWQPDGRAHAIVGVAAATTIMFTCGSSGPFMTYGCGLMAFGLWRLRFEMRMVRWALVAGLAVLQIFMKTPVWFVIAHLGVFSGSTSYYRAFLIDQTIRHFSEWWMIGTKYEHAWAPMLTDITNMYVRVAFDGGLVTLILFIVILCRCFAGVGRNLRTAHLRPRGAERCMWALGAALFAHVITFLAVWYWDQNIVNWYMLLAMIAALYAPPAAGGETAAEPEREAVESTAGWACEGRPVAI